MVIKGNKIVTYAGLVVFFFILLFIFFILESVLKFKSIFLYFIVILSVLYRTCLKFHQHRHSEWNEDLKVVCQSFILFGW